MLSELLETLSERAAKRTAEYAGIVRQLAAGTKVRPEVIEAAMEGAGKSPADLAADVERIEKRRVAAAIVAGSEDLRREREAIEERIRAADAELALANERHAQTTGPLIVRSNAIRDALSQSEAAKRELQATCDDSIATERADVRRKLDRLVPHVAELRRQANGVERINAEHARAALPAAESEVAALHARLAELDALALQP